MADPHVITALVRKRAELSGDLKKLDKQRRSIRDKIVHVDNALKLFGYEGNPRQIPPLCQYTRLFKRGDRVREAAESRKCCVIFVYTFVTCVTYI